jgi:hypothetical protein
MTNNEISRKGSLGQEADILTHFVDVDKMNPKKVGKLALRLLRELPDLTNIQKKMLNDVWMAKNPKETILRFTTVIHDCAIVMQDLVESGHHGMIMLPDDVIYPIKLDTRPNWLRPEDPWDEQDEINIQHEIAREYMVENQIKSFYSKIVLFPHFGFSGVPRIINIKYVPLTEDHVKAEAGQDIYKKVKE